MHCNDQFDINLSENHKYVIKSNHYSSFIGKTLKKTVFLRGIHISKHDAFY